MMKEGGTVGEVVMFTPEQVAQIQEAWRFVGSRLREYFDALTVAFRKWFPIISEAHRAYVKAVRTDYRRRQKARRRRARRR